MTGLLLALLAGLALAAVRLRDLLGATAVLGAYSLVVAILWCWMNAVDVAFTEAAVGAGISTVLMLAAIARVGRHERPTSRRFGPTNGVIACLVTAVALLYGAQDMPRVGDPNAPANVHPDVAVRFVERSPDREPTEGQVERGEVGPANVVTSVLGDYRGYDTLGETIVIFTAALCVVLLLRQAQADDRGERDPSAPQDDGEAAS